MINFNNTELIGWITLIYFLVIPFMCNLAWQDNNDKTFTKWYFTKSPSVNWLGYSIFLLLGLGSFVYVAIFFILSGLVYLVFTPMIWLYEFLFLNKDCSDLVSEELIKKEKVREMRDYCKKLYGVDFGKEYPHYESQVRYNTEDTKRYKLKGEIDIEALALNYMIRSKEEFNRCYEHSMMQE